jgi:hypothetical protein
MDYVDTEQQIMFELPESPLNNVPLSLEDRINLGFLEIGLKPKGKRDQLREKKQLILKYWGDRYRREYGFEWIPQTFRILAHFNRGAEVVLDEKKYEIDAVLEYTKITEKMMNMLSISDREIILKYAKGSSYFDLVRKVLDDKDPERLTYILDLRKMGHLGQVRGKIGEIFVFNDFYSSMSSDMQLLTNGDIKYFNRRYQNGTEIDGLFVFHREDSYRNLIDSLRRLDHLNIYERY